MHEVLGVLVSSAPLSPAFVSHQVRGLCTSIVQSGCGTAWKASFFPRCLGDGALPLWWQGKVPTGFLTHTSLSGGQRAHLPQLSPYKCALQTVQAHKGAVSAKNRTQI